MLAALDLHQHSTLHMLTSGARFAVCMGLHSGRVVGGGLGRDSQRFYTVIGEPTSLVHFQGTIVGMSAEFPPHPRPLPHRGEGHTDAREGSLIMH